mmetsp:Transcript_98702/g.279072  ORF Transcript_98702/g.279072 Transcript_98702/m.279072 type:complete len:100 (+) Transcript_98702:259-558(+)
MHFLVPTGLCYLVLPENPAVLVEVYRHEGVFDFRVSRPIVLLLQLNDPVMYLLGMAEILTVLPLGIRVAVPAATPMALAHLRGSAACVSTPRSNLCVET